MEKGTLIQNFRILDLLGQGGMGTVYRAWDELLQREVAIKALHSNLACDGELVDRFCHEATALARLKHPAIAALHTLIHDRGQWLMVMEHVDGERLDIMLNRLGNRTISATVTLFLGILDGVEHAHSQGVIHRDLKPSNIMVTSDGNPKLLDFGIAKMVNRKRMTQSGMLLGTPHYLAPEIIEGQSASIQTDIYALGIVLFELLTGQTPFSAPSDFALMRHHLETPVPSVAALCPAIPMEFDGVLARALAKLPGGRFQTVAEFRETLLAVWQSHATASTTVTGKTIEPEGNVKETRLYRENPPANPFDSLKNNLPAGQSLFRSAVAFTFCLICLAGGLWWRLNHPSENLPNPTQPVHQPPISGVSSPMSPVPSPPPIPEKPVIGDWPASPTLSDTESMVSLQPIVESPSVPSRTRQPNWTNRPKKGYFESPDRKATPVQSPEPSSAKSDSKTMKGLKTVAKPFTSFAGLFRKKH